ncbi:transcriptional regulator, SARP family protein [Actinoplanes sp. ATCC 53533]|uniref:ATP-binding protein n=1 Tax=Actinoplanes sp. ATCC 53533 TaxID=1288362 RepID=UPI000F787C99|nr:tetratricopeptide repeat protein [Actinoplanes sp. ATCC 53533]RSM64926.1 transcriptional regulator, SARP family protein [Actinoplanes sp. ATCC 53533]
MDETATTVTTLDGLGRLLRELRRRQARHHGGSPATYRDLAAATGWSHGVVGAYLSGQVLPPTDRFDVLIRLLGATPAEQGRLATARDRVEEGRRAVLAPPPGPRQLPSALPAFAGRAETLAGLDRWLGHAGHGVVAISGTAGVGKTTLAIHWAHRLTDRFPDGQLHLNLRGFDPTAAPVPPADAVREVLGALGAEPARIPAGLDAQAALYRSLLAGRRMLVVLDNAATAEQVRPLLPGGPGSLVLVTSRAQLTGLVVADGAHPVPLDLLPADEARWLLTARVGADRITTEPRASARIIAACARLPLALAVVGARLAVQPALTLAALADELEQDRLTTLDTGDPAVDVRSVLSWSYLRLSPDAARIFRLCALHPGPEIGLAALASLAGQPPAETRRLVTELVRVSLADEPGPGRYVLHDLLRAYAGELAAATDTQAERARLRDHYLHTAAAAAMRLHPARRPIPLPPPAAGVVLADVSDATAWFRAEGRVLVTAVRDSADTGDDRYAWQLAWTLADFLDREGRWQEWFDTQSTAAAAAERLGDESWQLFAHRSAAGATIRLRRFGLGRELLERSAQLAAGTGDRVAQAQAENTLAWLLELEGDPAAAIPHAQRAAELFAAAGEHRFAARAVSGTGWYAALTGDFHRALAICTRALTQQRELGDSAGLAGTLDSLGYICDNLGQHPAAISWYGEAVSTYQQDSDRGGEAATRARLATTLAKAGDASGARTERELALAIFDELDPESAAALRREMADGSS